KADGDARGGAALSMRAVTGKPIKFLSTGERTDALEPFHPERIASRILGMGDVLSLIEEAERKVDRRQAQRLARKIERGRKFDLSDFREQLRQMSNLGGVTAMMDKMPGMAQMGAQNPSVDDGMFRQMGVIIDSMTPRERRYPDLLNGSRKRRIASGSGTEVQDINRLLKQYRQMQKMFKKVGRKGGMQKLMRGMAAAGGQARAQGRRRR
ncbi:MAG: signal recognition particle protein, partial [Gammaproteobacteria bacterium]|nr:signal recognition particle protein [Gammaproteobacteria bacterium]